MAQKTQNIAERFLDKFTGSEDSQEVLRIRITSYFDTASAARKNEDWKWFLYDLWVDGNHYTKYDKNTKEIVSTSPRNSAQPKVTINKVYTTIRGVRNYVLRNRPRADTTPFNLTAENLHETVKVNMVLDYLHDSLKLRDKLKDTTWHALVKSVGFWQVLWNEEKQEVEVNVIDPYDLYWDPVARTPEEARYAFICVRRRLVDLREDPLYAPYKETLERLSGDNNLAASSMKARLLQYERGNDTSTNKDDGTIIVKECWLKEKKDGQTTIRIITLANDEIIRDEMTDLDRIPIFRNRSDAKPLSMYGKGWVKDLIPVNKLLNTLESSVAEYNVVMNKVKVFAPKGHGIRTFNNEHGQFVEYKRGFDPKEISPAPLSSAIFAQIDNVNRYMEDIGAYHEATAGRVPTGVTSGKGIEALQYGDSNNMSEVVENTEVFLEEVYEYILYLLSKKYQFVRNIVATTTTAQREFIAVIGESAAAKPDGVTVIQPKNTVDVKIGSWLAQTPDGRREAIKDLANIMLANQTPLDIQTILQGYETGNIADIVDRIRTQMEEQKAAELAAKEAEQKMGQPAASGPQQAIAALRSIVNGDTPQIPTAASPEYIKAIDQFIARSKEEGDDPELLTAMQKFRDQVAQRAAGTQSTPPAGNAPVSPPVAPPTTPPGAV